MYRLSIETEFAAAHNLREYNGKCERLHGHNYRVRSVVAGENLGDDGMLVDFHRLKDILDEVISRIDHRYLNEIVPFDELNPTTEHIARFIADEVDKGLPAGVNVAEVTCWESDKCAVTYVPVE